MVDIAKVRGAKTVMRQLRQKQRDHLKNTGRGLMRGGLLLQRLSQKVVPIKTGVLKNSAFTRYEGSFGTESILTSDPTVRVGYTASYAIRVHEDLTMRHKKGKIAKFLELPYRENRDKIMNEIRKGAKSK